MAIKSEDNPQIDQPAPAVIRATDADLKGVYATLAQVLFTKEEFLVDFINTMPGGPILSARVILSPNHAKRLMQVLSEQIRQYETRFNAIEPSNSPGGELGFQNHK